MTQVTGAGPWWRMWFSHKVLGVSQSVAVRSNSAPANELRFSSPIGLPLASPGGPWLAL
jgi:hypothetical protein